MSSCPTRQFGLASASSGTAARSARCSPDSVESVAGLVGPGTIIANYSVVKQVGEGGMGRVYKVWHPQLRKSFALKLLVEQLEQDAGAVDRFQSETLALAQLEHVNIVSAIDAGTWQGRPFLVTQFLEGTDLATHVANHGPFTLEQTARLALQIVRGMQAAHAIGFYHRDIKPSNLFLENNGHIKLLDFGLVRSETRESLTRTGCFMGSVDYLSPEQARDPRTADARSDIYSLGCTLLFLLSGKPPYPDADYPSLPAKLLAHGHQSPPWLEHALASSSHPLLTLVQRMLMKQPERRPQSAQEILDCLESIISTGFEPYSPVTVPRARQNSVLVRGVIGAGMVALLVGVTGFGWVFWGQVGEPGFRETATGVRLEASAVPVDVVALAEDPNPGDRDPSPVDRPNRITLAADETKSARGPNLPAALMGLPRSSHSPESQKFGTLQD